MLPLGVKTCFLSLRKEIFEKLKISGYHVREDSYSGLLGYGHMKSGTNVSEVYTYHLHLYTENGCSVFFRNTPTSNKLYGVITQNTITP